MKKKFSRESYQYLIDTISDIHTLHFLLWILEDKNLNQQVYYYIETIEKLKFDYLEEPYEESILSFLGLDLKQLVKIEVDKLKSENTPVWLVLLLDDVLKSLDCTIIAQQLYKLYQGLNGKNIQR